MSQEQTALRSNSVPTSGVIGQSLSAMGLSGVIGTSVPVVAIVAGSGGWLVWAIAAAVIMLVALCVALLSGQMATSGGLYGLASKSLGPLGALLTGWLMIALIGVAAGAGALSFGVYLGQFLTVFDITFGRVPLVLTSVAILAVGWLLSRIGARPAAWVMLVAEVATTIALLVVFVAVLITNDGSVVDTEQLSLSGSSVPLVLSAVVLGVGAFGGFESAAVYGREARNPTRAIPIAVIAAVAGAGVIWMFSSYVLFLGFQHSPVSLAASPAPMGTLAQIAGLDWYVYVVDLSLAFTIGASMIACFSWVARFMMTMSREGVAPAAWGRVHPKFRTPTTALNIAGIIWVTEVVVMGSISDTPLTTFGQAIGDMGGYPLLLVYGLVCVGAVRFQWQRGKRASVYVLIGVLGSIAMAYTLYDSVMPWPTFPNNIVPIVFVVATIAIVVLYFVIKRRRPAALAGVGSTVDDSSDST